MARLKRKIDIFLDNWYHQKDKFPLIIKGARQIGKTDAVENFANGRYESFVKINFALQPQFHSIFSDGYDVNSIIKNISLINPEVRFVPNKTLIFFDEIQACISAATSLKSFKIDGKYDVICSGSLMGINYNEIESNSVGYKEDYEMYSLDFEEFLWAKGYSETQINDLLGCMLELKALSSSAMLAIGEAFKEYLVVGGMPEVVKTFIENGNYSGTLRLQKQLLLDYEEDITKYAGGLDKAKILNVYRKIPVFLGKDNKKFQISKVKTGAKSRDYIGVVDWLKDAGIVNVCYCMQMPELPLKGNYNPDNFKIYFGDTGLLVGSLDEEAQNDLRVNKNFNTYKGAIYENIAADMLVKQGYGLYFYKNEKATIEIDFLVRDKNSLIPLEIKATDNSTPSLNNVIKSEQFKDVKYGIKFCQKNIGYNGSFYTFPYFLMFLLKRYIQKKDELV